MHRSNNRPDITAEEVVRLHQHGKTISQLASYFNCDASLICRRLQGRGATSSYFRRDVPVDVVTDLYVNKQLPCVQIAKMFNCSLPTIYNRLSTGGVTQICAVPSKSYMRSQKFFDAIAQGYISGKSVNQLSQELHCSIAMVYKTLVSLGIKRRTQGEAHKMPCSEELVREILRLYPISLGMRDVAFKLNIGCKIVRRILKENNITPKPKAISAFRKRGTSTRGIDWDREFKEHPGESDLRKAARLNIRHGTVRKQRLFRGIKAFNKNALRGCKYFPVVTKIVRATCYTRDKNVCQQCAQSVYPRKRHLHHIIHQEYWQAVVGTNYEEMNAPDNLITVCPSCHLKIHKRFRGLLVAGAVLNRELFINALATHERKAA